MYKKALRNTIVSTILTILLFNSLVANSQFVFITAMRYLAIDSDCNESYSYCVSQMDKFSEKGLYQKWLVDSGSTHFGKIVRALVFVFTVIFFIFFLYLLYVSISYIRMKYFNTKRRRKIVMRKQAMPKHVRVR
ncbi:MAG: hypothetical protein HFJ55_01430 [Clostridia bacterium]|nr:hypothetical protein [Clostridia bacterium]